MGSIAGDELGSRTRGVALGAIGVSFALAVGIGVLRSVNTEEALRSVELPGNVAFAVVFALPALLGLLATRRRPSLFVAAGILDLVLGFVTLISLIGVVFLAPGVLFLVSAGRAREGSPGPFRTIAAVTICVVLGSASFLALFVREEPACWARTASGRYVALDADRSIDGQTITLTDPPGTVESGCTSDTISAAEAVLAAGLVGLTLGAGWMIAKPREPGGRTPEIAGGGAYASAP